MPHYYSDSTALTEGLSTELMFSALRVLTRGLWLPPLLGDERGGMLRRLCTGGRGGSGGGQEGGRGSVGGGR